MKHILILLLSISITTMNQAQTLPEIIDEYDEFKEEVIENRRFKHSQIEPLILSLQNEADFRVKKEGVSIEGRNIYSVTWGNGPIDILMWSQMHGDEATATMAIFDIFNFLNRRITRHGAHIKLF